MGQLPATKCPKKLIIIFEIPLCPGQYTHKWYIREAKNFEIFLIGMKVTAKKNKMGSILEDFNWILSKIR